VQQHGGQEEEKGADLMLHRCAEHIACSCWAAPLQLLL
jgi:hypothetical protein